jgi:CheY-like chemotaxis protein
VSGQGAVEWIGILGIFGGRSVPKILVADDNSNIQKMVGLALKDQGIDVVAVGNGEAAVRKISDIRPDLVLADVFMPVRNGYEVCQYVKADSALSHIPVILLVGAFDPLDEQEAQRVGADGVLKKPFVPPEPLISMVKSALSRAAATALGGAAEKSSPSHAADGPIAPAVIHAPAAGIPEVMAFSHGTPEAAVAEAEAFVEEVPARPAELKIESGSLPAAFGSLLETPEVTEEPEEDFVSTTQPAVVLERDWNSGEPKEEEADVEEEEPASSWRRDGGDEALAEEPATGGAAHGWRDTPLAEAEAPAKNNYSGFVDAEETQEFVSASVPEVIPVEPVTAYKGDEATAAASTEKKKETPAMVSAEPAPSSVPMTVPSPVISAPPAEAAKPTAAGPWFSVAPNPWEAEAQKASQLASTWDAPKSPSLEPKKAETQASEATSPSAPEAVIPAATVEAIREEAAHVAESVVQTTGTTGAAKSGSTDVDMDAMVAKVMSKMNPDVLQALTRELLKPMIETIVKDELGAKKS